MTPEHEERIERLEKALLELVYCENYDAELDIERSMETGEWVSVPAHNRWLTEHYIDVDVSHIIGDLLDKYKPTKAAVSARGEFHCP